MENSSIPPVHLYRIGSDPEFLFTRIREWTVSAVAANSVLTANRTKSLSTFVGTDGHQATAELRPPPAHNIQRHLLDVALALSETEKYLHSKKHLKDVVLMSAPVVAAETLGGHIHTTMFLEDPCLAIALQHNYIWKNGQLVKYDNNFPAGHINSTAHANAVQEYAASAAAGRSLTPSLFASIMDYLLIPLEKWVQPWNARVTRNRKYGIGEDVVRCMGSPRPAMARFEKHAYVHYEYRVPSTWLSHPWLAYVYFALAKYTVINLGFIAPLALKYGGRAIKPQMDAAGASVPMNESYRQQLMDRLAALNSAGARRCADVRDMEYALKAVGRRREEWFKPLATIDIAAWRSLL